MSTLTLSLSSKDEHPAASLSAYQHDYCPNSSNVDCYRKELIFPNIIQGRMTFSSLLSPSAATEFYSPRFSKSTGVSGIYSTQGYLPTFANWILAHPMVTSSPSGAPLQANPGSHQDLTPYPPMPTKSPNTVHWTTQWDFSDFIGDENKERHQIIRKELEIKICLESIADAAEWECHDKTEKYHELYSYIN